MTAEQVVAGIRTKFGSGWMEGPVDTIVAGSGATEVKGIATTYAPSLEVLQKAVAQGRNMIISRESPYWARTNGPGGGTQFSGLPKTWKNGPDFSRQEPGAPETDPVLKAKRDYIAAHNLVVYRLFANWNAQGEDVQLKALSRAMGWEKFYKPSGGKPWAHNNGFFQLPPATLRATALNIKKSLGVKSLRIAGGENAVVHKAALSHGLSWLHDIQVLCQEPGVDLLVIGEPQWENELSLYALDRIDAGMLKGYIILGQQVSEEPGTADLAAWLKPLVPGIPVDHISAGEPSWMPAAEKGVAV